MKRHFQDQSQSLLSKKRNSSLFSIATVNSTDEIIDSTETATGKNTIGCPLDHSRVTASIGLDLSQGDEHDFQSTCLPLASPSGHMDQHEPHGSSRTSLSQTSQQAATITPRTSCTPSPLVSPLHILEKDDDDDDNENSTNRKPLIVRQTACCANDEATADNQNDDFRCGLVFEAGFKHFDRHNKLHKERPIRVTSIMDNLKKSNENLYARCRVQENVSTDASGFLDDKDFLRVHLPGYMQRLDKISAFRCCNGDNNNDDKSAMCSLDREAEQYKSIYFTPDSLVEAKKAAASFCSLVGDVLRGTLDFGFAVVRPPGHHAEPGLAGGYCIINNVAVAASYAKAKWNVNKVLIVDWDCHFGNGSQTIFQNDPSVLYFSVHRWQGGNFFPFLSNGGPTTVGTGDGAGFSIHVGWSRKGMGDDEYLAVWDHVLMPVANEFRPDLILVSAGFDAALGDMGDCCVTPECFGRLTRKLMTLETPICLTLEGGYVRSVMCECVQHVISALLNRYSAEQSQKEDDDDRRELGDETLLDTIDPSAFKDIKATMAAHRSYWKCFQD